MNGKRHRLLVFPFRGARSSSLISSSCIVVGGGGLVCGGVQEESIDEVQEKKNNSGQRSTPIAFFSVKFSCASCCHSCSFGSLHNYSIIYFCLI